MIDPKATIAAMKKAGVPVEFILIALECYQEVEVVAPLESAGKAPVDERLERIRAYDRDRKRRKKEAPASKAEPSPPENSTERKVGDIEITPDLKLIEGGKESGIARATPSLWPEFKKAFPKRAGDYDWKKAEVKFNRHVAQGVPPEAMIEGARSYAAWCDAEGKTGTQYVRQPTTWLNNEGWKNDYTPSRKTGFNATFDNLREQVERYSDPDDGSGGLEPPDQARFPI